MGSGSACVELSVSAEYIQVSVLSPPLPQINALVLRRAPKRADPDLLNALSFASAGDCSIDACACVSGFAWRGEYVPSYELLWPF